ncbi:MAG TPA: aminotransferase class IV [Vicinamibacterales bacterium]|nr:aminotransferase class IV [Vicinamibacterales bacterium]
MLDSRNFAASAALGAVDLPARIGVPGFMNAVVYVNGRITDADHASIAVFDHGFLYGEGIYETLRTYGREPFLFERHMARLRQSASLIALDVPYTDADLLGHARETMAAMPGLDEAYIRILLTRGVGELSYNPAACPRPSLVIIVKPFPGQPARTFTQGIRVSLVHVRRNHPDALNPQIKSNNLMNNALAMQEALRRGGEEALMQNQAGELAECSQSNFFLVRGGEVMTPPLSAGLLPGVTRAFILELAAAIGLLARETRLTPDDLRTASEAFITGTTREVTPVVAVDELTIGTGQPGPTTRRLLEAFRARVASGQVRS